MYKNLKTPFFPFCAPRILHIVLVLLAFFHLPLSRSAAQNLIYVTTPVDKISTTGGCSLKEAIYSANWQTNKAVAAAGDIITTQCVPGTGNDTIVLPPGATLNLSTAAPDAYNYVGLTATPFIFSNITIEGYGASLVWTGTQHARAFAVGDQAVSIPAAGVNVSGTGSLILRNVYVKGFSAKGGDAGCKAGGGLGAGGAIYLTAGTLIIENSTFSGNSSVGGSGGGPCNGSQGAGGGGGLSGNGGNGGPEFNFGGSAGGEVWGGGGGGGSQGNGGDGGYKTTGVLGGFGPTLLGAAGGGGGGTLSDGTAGTYTFFDYIGTLVPGVPGMLCGGIGGNVSQPGGDATCAGAGGGGGGYGSNPAGGGSGTYGGGGGGGAATNSGLRVGGTGGFAGGGGGDTGSGGFGGGSAPVAAALPGSFGGKGAEGLGGGGGGLGGAIFNEGGGVRILNSTFTANFVRGGPGAPLGNGTGAGGAIFSLNGHLTVNDSTISGNQSTNSGGGIVMFLAGSPSLTPLLTLENTIIANNGAAECSIQGSVAVVGAAGNLIQSNDNCPGVVSTNDPQLGPLQNNGGLTPTMAISTTSSAFNTADASTSLGVDQRGQQRPGMNRLPDIGAFELCISSSRFINTCENLVNVIPNPTTLTIQASPSTGGTTAPTPGSHSFQVGSIVSLQAKAGPGSSFVNWTGNVSDVNNPSTLIVMLEPQMVTANFTTCNCAEDVTSSVGVTRAGFILNPVTARFAQIVTVKNTSSNTITGPLSLVLDSLSSNATLFNATGATDTLELPAGSPYVSSNINLATGQSVFFALQFTDSTRTAVTYNTRVLAGPGAR